MRSIFLTCVVAGTLSVSVAAQAAKPAVKPTKAFGLTEALAVLFACPDSRFENANVIALGGVVRENAKRIDAAPANSRMDLMTSLVAEETAKAKTYLKNNKIDCAQDIEPAAAYWNAMISDMAAERDSPGPATSASPAEPSKPKLATPRNALAKGVVPLP